MIIVPKDFSNNPLVDKKFKDLISFINKLEEDLQYPNCEGYADQKRLLIKAQDDLIMQGIL